jgi:hypothetical protein
VSKTPPPLLGFNNNVRHRGRVFHIQTEDSGIKRPHIHTHLFGDGGRILKSVRLDYAEHLARDDLPAVVRKLMKEQHKGLFISLRAGELDDLIEKALGPLAPREASPPPPSSPIAASSPFAAPSPEAVAEQAGVLETPQRIEIQNPPAEAPRRVSSTTIPTAPRTPVVHMLPSPIPATYTAPARTAESRVRPASVPPRPASVPPPSDPRIPTPPPPSHSIDSAVEAMAAKAAGQPLPSAETTPPGGTRLQKRRPQSDSSPGRYSISRPANIFEEAPPSESRSIFGDPLIGEKSLDEVILSYLAEDLENPQSK